MSQFILLLMLASTCAAAEHFEFSKQLQHIKTAITQLKTQINITQVNPNNNKLIESALYQSEMALSALSQTMDQQRNQIQKNQKIKTMIANKNKQLLAEKNKLMATTSALTHLLYLMYEPPLIQLHLFDFKKYSMAMQNITTVKYLIQHILVQEEKIALINQHINVIDQLLGQQIHKVKNALSEQKEKETLLEEMNRNRDIIIAIMQHANNKEVMEKDALQQINHQINNKHTQQVTGPTKNQIPTKPFASLRGKLPVPAHGKIQYKSKNMLIISPQHQDVHTVAAGKVIFAQWIPFYGLLAIVEHDHGYLTLYGHNQRIYKQVGAQVHAGDIIAQSGQTGGLKENTLFFSLRHGKTILDSKQWIKG